MKLTMPWHATTTHKNGIGGKLDYVRKALSDEADHLAAVAADMGRDIAEAAGNVTHDAGNVTSKVAHDAGNQVANVTQDVSSGASSLAQKIVGGAAGIGAAIAASGRTGVRDAQELGKDARKLRLTTEPAKSGPDLMPGVTLLGGFSAGIALMYFLDPEQGKRRRALFRDQLNKWTRIGRETVAGTAKDLRNRSAGVMHETRKAVSGLTGEAAANAEDETSMYAPTGFGNGIDTAAASPSTDFGQVPAYNQGSEFGQSTEFGQPSEYEEQHNRDEQSRIEVS